MTEVTHNNDDPIPDIGEPSSAGRWAFFAIVIVAIVILALRFFAFGDGNTASISSPEVYTTGARGVGGGDVVITQPEPEVIVKDDTETLDKLSELQRQIELLTQRRNAEELAAEQLYWESRTNNPIIIYNDPASYAKEENSDEVTAVEAAISNGIVTYGGDRTQGNLSFEQEMANTQAATVYATQIDNISDKLIQGTVISGILETAINTDLPGSIRALISHDVYSFDRSQILLPAGSRLVGEYQSGIVLGDARVFIVWSRAITPSGVSVRIDSRGTDPLGRSGLSGDVESYFWQKFGSTALVSILGVGWDYQYRLSNDLYEDWKAGITRRRTIDQEDQAALDAIQQLSMSMANETRNALSGWIERPPTIHIDQGTRISILTNKDMDFSALAQKGY